MVVASLACPDFSGAGSGDFLFRKVCGSGRVLIISPHFPPINAPDHHRVRLALPHFAENGWQAEILAVRAEEVEGVFDGDLEAALPEDLVVHRVKAISAKWTRRLGWGSLARRAYGNLRRRGNELLASGRFDLIFFSTTQFGVLPLGPYWKRRYGVPYVLDFQDEWTGAYYEEHPEIEPPGGCFKCRVSRRLARRQEPRVIREAAGIVSVSRDYNERLRERYPELRPDRFYELPFGGAAADFECLERIGARQHFFDRADGRKHWVHVGRGGADMQRAAEAFFAAVRRALEERELNRDELRVHFIGTSYAPGKLARESFAPLARSHGLSEMVSEYPARVPYFTALRCLREASAVLVLGSDDAGYTASKIYPALWARRPLLALFHEASPAVKVLRDAGADTVMTFATDEAKEEMAERIFRDWILAGAFDRKPAMDEEALARHSAAEMTRRLSGIFNAARAGAVAVQ